MNASTFEEAAIRRVLTERYHYDSQGLTFDQAQSELEDEIASDIDRLYAWNATTQTIKTTLYGVMGWRPLRIRKFERNHDEVTEEEFFVFRLEVETMEYLYKKYVTAKVPKGKTEKMVLKARLVSSSASASRKLETTKRKSLKKGRNRSIENMDVSEFELDELKGSKALHEARAAFHAASHEPIKSGDVLSPEVHTWLKREIFQAINANVKKLPTPAQMWRTGKKPYRLLEAEARKNGRIIVNIRKELIKINKKFLPFKQRILRLLFPGLKNVKGKKFPDSAVLSYLGNQQGLINTHKDVKNARKRLNEMKIAWAGFKKQRTAQVFFQRELDSLITRNNALLAYWSKRISSKIGASSVEHQETHLSEEEEYAWLERERPQPIGLPKPEKMWKKGKNTSKLLWHEIAHNTQNISEVNKEVRNVMKNIQFYQTGISKLTKKEFDEAKLKEYMKTLKKYANKGDKTAKVYLESIKEYQKKLKLENKKLLENQGIMTTLTKRNKELRAFINSMRKGKKSKACFLTVQEEKDVIFW